MKNVLFLLDYYLPNASANGICISKLSEEFVKKGIGVSIICFEDDARKTSYGENNEKLYTLIRPKPKKHLRKLTYYSKWLFSRKHLPAENKSVIKEMLVLAEKVINTDSIDTVICTHLPLETVSVGKALKEKYPHLNIVSYMLDSLSGGFLPRLLPASFCRKKKLRFEKQNLSHFDRVILMESSREHHEKYNKTANWYKNAYFLDVPALCKTTSDKDFQKEETDETVLCFIGTMCDGVRTPYALLQALSNISDLKIRLIIAGKNYCENLQSYLNNSNNVTLDIRGEVPYDEAQKILRLADFPVNIGNVNPNLVPSKIFEYMSYGKPIISTYTSNADSSIPYLSKYPAVFLLDEQNKDTKAISASLKSFLTEHKKTSVPYESLEKQLYNNTPTALYDLLSSEK